MNKRNLLIIAILICSVSATGYFAYNSNRQNILLSERDKKITQYTSIINDFELQIATLQKNIITLETEIKKLQSQIDTLCTQDLGDSNTTISNHRKYGNLTIQQTKQLIEKNSSLMILDVRMVWEYDGGHIEGAININIYELESRTDELDVNTEYLVYCRLGVRSTRAMSILNDNGFYKVYNMLGGITAWKEAGYPVVQ